MENVISVRLHPSFSFSFTLRTVFGTRCKIKKTTSYAVFALQLFICTQCLHFRNAGEKYAWQILVQIYNVSCPSWAYVQHLLLAALRQIHHSVIRGLQELFDMIVIILIMTPPPNRWTVPLYIMHINTVTLYTVTNVYTLHGTVESFRKKTRPWRDKAREKWQRYSPCHYS